MSTKILGVDVLVSVGGVTIGSQTDATLKIEGKDIDASDKTTGGWDVSLVGNRKWSIECNCIALDGDNGQAALETAVLNGDQVSVSFAHGTRRTFTGSATIMNYELTGPKDDMSTCKFTLKGASALA